MLHTFYWNYNFKAKCLFYFVFIVKVGFTSCVFTDKMQTVIKIIKESQCLKPNKIYITFLLFRGGGEIPFSSSQNLNTWVVSHSPPTVGNPAFYILNSNNYTKKHLLPHNYQ